MTFFANTATYTDLCLLVSMSKRLLKTAYVFSYFLFIDTGA